MIDEESYEQAINSQWEKLSKAQSLEELKEVLRTWPEPKDYEIEAQSAEGHKEEPKDEKDD